VGQVQLAPVGKGGGSLRERFSLEPVAGVPRRIRPGWHLDLPANAGLEDPVLEVRETERDARRLELFTVLEQRALEDLVRVDDLVGHRAEERQVALDPEAVLERDKPAADLTVDPWVDARPLDRLAGHPVRRRVAVSADLRVVEDAPESAEESKLAAVGGREAQDPTDLVLGPRGQPPLAEILQLRHLGSLGRPARYAGPVIDLPNRRRGRVRRVGNGAEESGGRPQCPRLPQRRRAAGRVFARRPPHSSV
jgi:hypothetical protein